MKRTPALLLLFAVSVGAGAWLTLSPPPPPVPDEAESCGQAASCEAIPDDALDAAPTSDATPVDSGSAAVPGRTAPVTAPSAQPAGPAMPATQADGIRLREEADRLIAEGRAIEGLAALRKATEADPSARNHGDLGSMLEKLTALDEAVRHLRRAAELDPANADRWIALANAYYRKVELGEAWKAERRAREAEPGLVLVTDPQGRRVRAGDSAADKP